MSSPAGAGWPASGEIAMGPSGRGRCGERKGTAAAAGPHLSLRAGTRGKTDRYWGWRGGRIPVDWWDTSQWSTADAGRLTPNRARGLAPVLAARTPHSNAGGWHGHGWEGGWRTDSAAARRGPRTRRGGRPVRRRARGRGGDRGAETRRGHLPGRER